jgi:hypothetical protein
MTRKNPTIGGRPKADRKGASPGYSTYSAAVAARTRLLVGSAILLALYSPLAAQWLHYPTPGVARTPDGKPDLTAPAPRTGDGKPDFSGV